MLSCEGDFNDLESIIKVEEQEFQIISNDDISQTKANMWVVYKKNKN